MPFTFHKQAIAGLVVIQPKVYSDERGFFLERYKQSDFLQNGVPEAFLQDNASASKKGVLRGMHYQMSPKAQGKLVRVAKGRVYDVAVDMRKSSPTLGSWFGIELSEENQTMLYVPPGFAHGFLSLEDDSVFEYKCTNEYSKEHERGLHWNDPTVGILWPMEPTAIAERDAGFPRFAEAEKTDDK